MEQKGNIISVVLAIALIAVYFVMQGNIDDLESQLNSTETIAESSEETTEGSSYIASDTSSLESQLDDLNNQLITARGELQSVQQKLILSTSKSQVLEDEVAQMKDARPQVKELENLLAEAVSRTAVEVEVAQVSQEKYDNLAAALAEQNLSVAIRNTNRIINLKETTSASSITAAAVPLLSIATLIEYTRNEIKNYCNDIEEMIALENDALGKVRSLTGVVLERFEAQCR